MPACAATGTASSDALCRSSSWACDERRRPAAEVPPSGHADGVTDMTGGDVTIVVLNWNGGRDTVDCLESLGQADLDGASVLVVDNGSRDDSLERIRSRFPAQRILALPDNRGYAGGNNAGMRAALEAGAGCGPRSGRGLAAGGCGTTPREWRRTSCPPFWPGCATARARPPPRVRSSGRIDPSCWTSRTSKCTGTSAT